MIGINEILSENAFYQYVYNEYQPSSYESKELEDSRFQKGIYYSHVCKTRSYLVYRELASRLSKRSKVIDLGLFPGTLIRQLRFLLNDKITYYGVGLNVDKDFEDFMGPYLESCVNVELDPFYSKSDEKIYIPFEDNTFDAVVATEVLEHLISPVEMIAEGSRILRKGGFFMVTTPNVSHIGAVLKLMLGISNYERLDRSPMYLQDDPWRGHIRFYDKKELKTLFHRNGLRLVSHRYYTEHGWNHSKRSFLKKFVTTLVDKCTPIYRQGHFGIFEKI
jgi:SAM-dependent methyltransferase